MIITVKNLRFLINEIFFTHDDIEIGPTLGSPEKGFNVRVTKYFRSSDSIKYSRMWNGLRAALQKNGMKFGGFWRVNSVETNKKFHTNEPSEATSTIIDLRSRDFQSAKLERQKLIGDIEAVGLQVDEAEELKSSKHSSHPYR